MIDQILLEKLHADNPNFERLRTVRREHLFHLGAAHDCDVAILLLFFLFVARVGVEVSVGILLCA